MQDLLLSSHRSENCSKKFALIGRSTLREFFQPVTELTIIINHIIAIRIVGVQLPNKINHFKSSELILFTEEAIRISYKKSRDNTKTVRGESVEFKSKYKC